jgi:predicted transcriptional regulator
MGATKNLARYVQEKAINLSAMSRTTGIPYSALYDSLANKKENDHYLWMKQLLYVNFLGSTRWILQRRKQNERK